MKKIITLIALLTSIGSVSAQTAIAIPFDLNPVNMDGQINTTEWQDADSFFVVMANNDSILVYYKHDMKNIYFAFAGKMESNTVSQMFPEVMFDPQYLRSSTWNPGQWWFHVSARDCEHEGGYGIYGNCNASQPGWKGIPNFTPGPPYTDSVEIQIPYAKIGFNSVTQSTMGIAIVITNTQNVFRTWPPSADRAIPSSWSIATINKFPVDVKTITNTPSVKCYPNPASDKLNVEGAQPGATVMLIDVYGKTVDKGIVTEGIYQIETAHLASGVYYLSTNGNGDIVTQKVMLKK